MGELEAFAAADQVMTEQVLVAVDGDLGRVSPATPEWTVRELIAHVADDNRWVGDMLAGRRTTEVRSQYADDPLDGNPRAAWTEAAESAEAAVAGLADLGQIVHLSYGDTTARDYIRQMVIDRVIHAWDLGVATRHLTDWPGQLVTMTYDWLEPQADNWREAGLLSHPVSLAADAAPIDRLVALAGRNATRLAE